MVCLGCVLVWVYFGCWRGSMRQSVSGLVTTPSLLRATSPVLCAMPVPPPNSSSAHGETPEPEVASHGETPGLHRLRDAQCSLVPVYRDTPSHGDTPGSGRVDLTARDTLLVTEVGLAETQLADSRDAEMRRGYGPNGC